MKVHNQVIDFRRAEKQGLLDADFVAKTEGVGSKPLRDSRATEASVEEVKGIGPVMAKKLEKLGIETIGDLAHTKAAFPLEASFNPREAAALVGLRAGLAKTLGPRPAIEPLPPTIKPAVDPRPSPSSPDASTPISTTSTWAQRELAAVKRNADGTIPTFIDTGINKWGWYDGYTQNMTEQQYLQHRQEQIEHMVYQHELRYP